MAYARLAGLEPVTGLWAAVPGLLAYAALGTSSRLSIGPESASALLAGSAVATLVGGGGTSDATAVAAALAVAVGVVSLVAWAARLGFLADLLSKPVLVGYMAGVAVIMIVSQLPNLTGIASQSRETVPRVTDILGRLGELELAPLLIGAGVVAALVLLQRWKHLPGPLIVVLVATAATGVLGLESRGVATVGAIPAGLPDLAFPLVPARLWPAIFAAAVGIFVVVFSDTVLTGRAFAARSGDEIDANQDLLALAGANAAAGLVGGFPVSSSGSRTAIVDAAGGTSQVVSVFAAVCVAAVLLFAGPVLESFPLAALGGLIVYAAARLVESAEMRRIAAFRRSEAVVMAAAFAGVVVFDLLPGIGIAVALSVAELFSRIARAHDAVEGEVPGLAGLHDVDDYESAQTVPGLVVYRYDAPLCFANAQDFRLRVLDAVAAESTPVVWVLLNMEANVEIDITATDMLEQLRAELAAAETVLALARVKHDLLVYLDRAGLVSRIGPDRIFFTLPTALDAFRHRNDETPPPP
jgi:high affinity sulfate transporter 1